MLLLPVLTTQRALIIVIGVERDRIFTSELLKHFQGTGRGFLEQAVDKSTLTILPNSVAD